VTKVRIPKRKLPNIILTILVAVFLLFCLVYMRHLAVTNSERIDRQDSIISKLVVQRDEAQDGAAAAVGAVEEANDKLEASGQTPVEIPAEAIVGATGPRGVPGADSTVPGPVGPQGRPGIDGTDGVDGQDGAPGAAGSDGTDGVDGEDGADGSDGADGQPGADSTVPGPVGPQGPQGEPGQDGRDGLTGADGAPPAGWTAIRADGTTETCVPAENFDPVVPRYECTADGGAVPETPEPTEGEVIP